MTTLAHHILNHYISCINDGYGEYVAPALKLIAKLIERGDELPEMAKKYLISALSSAEVGISLDQSFKANGRKKISKISELIEIAEEVHSLRQNDVTIEEAILQVSNRGAGSPSKVRDVYYTYKVALENKNED